MAPSLPDDSSFAMLKNCSSGISNNIPPTLMATAMAKEVEKLNTSGEIPQEKLLGIGKLYKELDDKEILQHAYKKGERLPDFCLPNANGDEVDMEDLRYSGGGPLVITFFRGDWCPYCHSSVNILNDHARQFQQLGATVIAISPQSVSSCAQMQQQLLVSGGGTTTTAHANEDGIYDNVVTLLSDTDCEYAQDCNIALCLDDPLLRDVNHMVPKYNQQESLSTKDDSNKESCWFVPVPTTYVIDSKGIILYRFLDTEIWKRVEPYSIMEILREQRRQQQLSRHDDSFSFSSSTSSIEGVDEPPRKPQSPSARRRVSSKDVEDGRSDPCNCNTHYKPKRRTSGVYSIRRRSFVQYQQCSRRSNYSISSSSSKSLLSILKEPLPVLDEESQPNTDVNRAA